MNLDINKHKITRERERGAFENLSVLGPFNNSISSGGLLYRAILSGRGIIPNTSLLHEVVIFQDVTMSITIVT